MRDESWVAALVIASVLSLAAVFAYSTANSVSLRPKPVPAVTVAIARPCVFLAYDPTLNAYVCLDGAAAPLPAQPALVPPSSFLPPLSEGGR